MAALISSSARHSAMVLMFLKAASLAPVHSSQMAYKTRDSRTLEGETGWQIYFGEINTGQ